MPTTARLFDPAEVRRMIRRRERLGLDRYDEVWDGVYVMAAQPNFEHQDFVGRFVTVFRNGLPEEANVLPGCNVSDQAEKWKKNYRCPDVAVVLPGNPAEIRRAYLYGGPDFLIEIASPRDTSRDKFDFYFKVGVREVLIVGRKPWQLELYRRDAAALQLVGTCERKKPTILASQVIPFTFSLTDAIPRPRILVTRTADAETTRI